MGNFLTTKWGSYLKAFLGIMLAYIMANGGDVLKIGGMELLGATTVSFLPFLIKLIGGIKNKFWNSVPGGLLKTFITVGLAYIVQHGGFVGLDWGALVNAGIMAIITVIVNGSNPSDPRYGAGTPKLNQK